MKLRYQNKEINLTECKTFYSRFKGFMGKRNINSALLFNHCNSVHTFFMKENIIVVFTDKNKNILKKVTCPKNRILFCKKAYFTYEFPYYTKDEEINYILKSNS